MAEVQVLLPVLHNYSLCWQSLPSGFYSYTYKNNLYGVRIISTPQSIMLPQKLVTCQPVRRFPTCYHVYRNPLLGPLLSLTQSTPSLPISSRYTSISSHQCLCPLSGLFLPGFPTITLYAFLCFSMHAISPNPCILLHLVVLLILVFGQEYIMKLIMQFSVPSYHLYPLRSKYIPQHPVLKHLCFAFFT